MISVITFILALGMVSSFNLSDVGLPGRELKNEGRIYNGINAVPGQFPYQVKIEANLEDFKLVCGGALIHPEWVLTAAHCLEKFVSMVVTLGETTVGDGLVSFQVGEEMVIQHENFKDFENDIGLIRIPGVRLCKKIKTVRLPSMSSSYSNYLDESVIFSGFGLQSDHCVPKPNALRWGRMKVISNEICKKVFIEVISAEQICVESTLNVSPCKGDSGGPLVLASDNTLIGISAFGDDSTCEDGYPAVFTRVTSYLDWIKTKTGITF